MHVEVFLPPLTKEAEYWLFDYGKKDALTGNAKLLLLGKGELS